MATARSNSLLRPFEPRETQEVCDLSSVPDAANAGGLLTVKQAADYLAIGRRTLYDLLKSKRLPYYRVGTRRAIRIKRDDLDAYLAECLVPAEGVVSAAAIGSVGDTRRRNPRTFRKRRRDPLELAGLAKFGYSRHRESLANPGLPAAQAARRSPA